jgi:hypothetical protein
LATPTVTLSPRHATIAWSGGSVTFQVHIVALPGSTCASSINDTYYQQTTKGDAYPCSSGTWDGTTTWTFKALSHGDTYTLGIEVYGPGEKSAFVTATVTQTAKPAGVVAPTTTAAHRTTTTTRHVTTTAPRRTTTTVPRRRGGHATTTTPVPTETTTTTAVSTPRPTQPQTPAPTTATTAPTTVTTPAPTTVTTPAPRATYAEATGDGPVHTWSNPNGPSGTEGPTLAANTVYSVYCRTTGTSEGSGDNWWYLIAGTSDYGSADAFCDEGATTCPGGFAGTPAVDSSVPTC